MFLIQNRTIDITTVATNLPTNDPAEWSAATSYDLGARVQRYRKVYQSTIGSNLGTDPALENQDADAPKWLVDGNINAMKAFDGVLANKLTATRGAAISSEYQGFGIDPDLTAVVLDFAVIAGENIVTLFGLDAMRVRLIGISAGGAVVYDETRVSGGRWVTNYWEWFTFPLVGWKRIQVFDGFPLSCARLLVCLEGEAVALGEVTIGKGLFVGRALTDGTGAAHRTASVFEINQFGNVTLVPRPTRRENTYRVKMTRLQFEQIEGLISDMIGKLVTAIGSADRPATIACGAMGEPEWDESLPGHYIINFMVKGVI
jgi:hypothetical protein